jgi:leader peptidase (prepilin peptidase)/N-methyltransferase
LVEGWRDLPVIWAIALALASGSGFLFLNMTDAIFGTALAAATLVVAAADLDRFEIPDFGSAAILICGLGWTAVTWGFDLETLGAAAIRCIAAAGLLLAVRVSYRAIRNVDGLGLGDVKLAGAGASWLSWSHAPIALLLAVIAAIGVVLAQAVYARQRVEAQTAVPLGAFLAPAIWIVWFGQMNGL